MKFVLITIIIILLLIIIILIYSPCASNSDSALGKGVDAVVVVHNLLQLLRSYLVMVMVIKVTVILVLIVLVILVTVLLVMVRRILCIHREILTGRPNVAIVSQDHCFLHLTINDQ